MIKLRNIKNNFNEVSLGKVTLYFSYETIIGFHVEGKGYTLSENLWGTTTGRHLNLIADKSRRIAREEFLVELNKAMEGYKYV